MTQPELAIRAILPPTGDSIGTCFAVKKDLFLTAAHVVEGLEEALISDSHQPVVDVVGLNTTATKLAKVVWRSEKYDIAAVKIDGKFTQAANFFSFGAEVSLGENVTCCGYPLPTRAGSSTLVERIRLRAFQGNIVSTAYEPLSWWKNIVHPIIELSFPILDGQSGGPILNTKGQVIGICTGLAEQFSIIPTRNTTTAEDGRVHETAHGWFLGVAINLPEVLPLDEGLRKMMESS
ncbi:trypsin-like peptidase domain-containing protein [Patescibacteria group bacterium]|nr:trypsin-like peptidase domain-containing protein [Patescibacteria group bacterium]MBP9710248.1 trypsin-like peptidase domain-containing protein [Patescibacteria group bacterium]